MATDVEAHSISQPIDSFACFTAFPPELRFRIWENALLAWSFWSAARCHAPDPGPGTVSQHAGHDASATRRPLPMAFVGPTPCLAGFSSREAWRLMRKLYQAPIRALHCADNAAPVYWINLERTVVYLGDRHEAACVMANFGANDLAKFMHVVLLWHQFRGLVETCQSLSTSYPSLRTIIVQRVAEGPEQSIVPFRNPLPPTLAAYYISLLEGSQPELPDDGCVDVAYFNCFSMIISEMFPRECACCLHGMPSALDVTQP